MTLSSTCFIGKTHQMNRHRRLHTSVFLLFLSVSALLLTGCTQVSNLARGSGCTDVSPALLSDINDHIAVDVVYPDRRVIKGIDIAEAKQWPIPQQSRQFGATALVGLSGIVWWHGEEPGSVFAGNSWANVLIVDEKGKVIGAGDHSDDLDFTYPKRTDADWDAWRAQLKKDYFNDVLTCVMPN